MRLGTIEDLEFNLRWDTATLATETGRRACILADMGIGRADLVAIAHSGSAFFFADLLAVWSVGATAACLDSTLTEASCKRSLTFRTRLYCWLTSDQRRCRSRP